MAWTYTTLKDAITDYAVGGDETNFVNNLPVFIQQAEDRILKTVQLPNFRKNVVGSLTSSDQYLATPDDFLAPYSLAVDNGSTGYDFLLFKKVAFIRQAFPDNTVKATPKYYATFSSSFFIVAPTPDVNYAVELHYFYKPESIVTAGTSWLGTNAESALFYGSLIEAYTFQKGDADMLQVCMNRYDSAMESLQQLADPKNVTDEYRRF